MSSAVETRRDLAEWAAIVDIARHLGVSAPTVAKRVRRLEGQGLLSSRAEGVRKLVNVEEYFAAAEATFDPVRAANGAMSGSRASQGDDLPPPMQTEQIRKIRLQADLAEVQLDKARGLLVATIDVEDAMAKAAGEIVRVLEAVPGRAAEFATAVARDGEQGARRMLREMVRDVRERLAASMSLLPGSAEAEVDVIRYEDVRRPKAAPAPRETKRREVANAALAKAETKVSKAKREARKTGRPSKYETKPWVAKGISRASYYRGLAKA
jgi:DNA-binding Lrp family transcriptional regulator